MPIPKDILAVPRPKNSIVIAYGKDKNLFAVRQRIGCKRVNGQNRPINGPTIGHIVDGKYIPLQNDNISNVNVASVELKDWANVVLCDNLFKDILNELLSVYSYKDSLKIYCISILRVCNHGIKDYELKEAYENSFLSQLYPDVALSKNTVSKFLNDLGKVYSRIVSFMTNRAAAVPIDHHLLVDSTLKTDNSKVNSLSDFSRKSKVKGSRNISVLYAFDLEKMEPVCSKCFPGDMLDVTAYSEFISENNITTGVIVDDKGFPESAAYDYFELNPDLHYINPIKRNSKLIKTHKLLDFTGMLKGYEGITYRKEKCVGKDKWLYSFRSSKKAAKEEEGWLKKAREKNNYDLDEFNEKRRVSGVIILESDLDLPPETIYRIYADRWEIEIVMKYYKSACEFDETRVHDDYSVLGSEFCDFLSTLLTFRLIKKFDQSKLLEKNTYKKLMSILFRAKKVKLDGEWKLIKINPSQLEILQQLDLVEKPTEPPKRKRGRPKGSTKKR